jgi:hypothetical protein
MDDQSDPGTLAARVCGPLEVSAILGVFPARVYKLRKDAKEAKERGEPPPKPSRNPFRGDDDALLGDVLLVRSTCDRLVAARSLALASSQPALAVNCAGFIMGSNPQAEWLLYRPRLGLIGLHAREVGIPEQLLPQMPSSSAPVPDEEIASPPLLNARVFSELHPANELRPSRWRNERTQFEMITRRKAAAYSHPGTLEPRALELPEDLQAVCGADEEWHLIPFRSTYPDIGGEPPDASVRYMDVDDDWRRLRLYCFDVPRLADQVRRDAVPSAAPPEKHLELLHGYARQIATRFLAESVTLFFFRLPEFRGASSDADSCRDQRGVAFGPRYLAPLGWFGLPDELMRSEFYDTRTDFDERTPLDPPAKNVGLVTTVLASGESRIFDFKDPQTRDLVRQPNFRNFQRNSRLGALENGVMVPIQQRIAGGRQVFGLLRLLNLFQPVSSLGMMKLRHLEPLKGTKKPRWLLELERIAEQLAFAQAEILRASQWSVLEAITRRVTTTRGARDFVSAILEHEPWLRGFEAIVQWRLDNERLIPENFVRCVPEETSVGESYAGMAITSGEPRGVDIAVARKRVIYEGEMLRIDAPGAAYAGIRIRNGFAVPIRRSESSFYGCIVYYNSWVAEADAADVSYTHARDLCVVIADMIRLKLERDDDRQRQEDDRSRIEELQRRLERANETIAKLIDRS